jgi:fucose permease
MNETINTKKLFLASRIALVATAMTFAIRASLIGVLGNEFNIPPFEMGIVTGTAFWGFTLSMMAGGFLCDLLGMKKLLLIAFLSHLTGIILTILAFDFWTLFISTLLVGIANGMVEAACNPLVATLFPDQKTKKLNQFHVWFPGGIVIGGLTAFVLDKIHAPWQYQIASILIPSLTYGFLFFAQSFPVTERINKGISTLQMIKECKRPLFLFMVVCMLLTASTELGTKQWIAELLGNVGVPSILLLVFINGLMAIGRSFAGEIEHRISASGMLLFSAIFSAIGLFLLSQATGYWSFAAAGIFALGICFFWPTMLGFVSENIPDSGALGLSVMGGAGMLSVSIILPFMGNLYEAQTISHLSPGYTLEDLKIAKLAGGAETLKYIALLPFLLIFAFGGLYLKRKNN